MSDYDKQIQTVSKILRNKYNIIREGVDIYKCGKCEGTHSGKPILVCPDRNCRGPMRFHRRIPQSKVEEITSRRAARQCPICMRIFYIWVEKCPYCSTTTLKGKISNNKDPRRKLYDYQMTR